MKFGPFPFSNIEEMCKVLDRKEIAYKVELSKQWAEDEVERAKHVIVRGQELTSPGATHYIDIDDDDLLRLGRDLENYGVIAWTQSDTSVHEAEWICPLCRFSSPKPGMCPRHPNEQLLEFSWFVEMKRKSSWSKSKVISVLMLTMSAVGIFMQQCKR